MAAVAAAAVALPAHSDPIAESEFFTNHSMGCMLLRNAPIMSKNSKQSPTLNRIGTG